MADSETLKKELIDGLQTDLAHEYQAILTYTNYAALARGIHRPLLKDFFDQEAIEELRHAQFLANKITALGGDPVSEPADVVLHHDPTKMLEEVLEAETKSIERYVERRAQAEEYGDYGLAVDLDEIISDETDHKEETQKLLQGIVNE